MGKFLRDRQIRNLSITTERIEELFRLCYARARLLEAAGVDPANIEVWNVIRFDGKGCKTHQADELLIHYRQAKSVERLVFMVETTESINSNRKHGESMEVVLDREMANIALIVSGDDEEWVNGTFSAFQEVFDKSSSKFGFIRTVWTELVVQIVGVSMVFVLSLLMAKKVTPIVAVDYPFLISFLFIFIVGINLWAVLQRLAQRGIFSIFPNVAFVRDGKEFEHWAVQGLILTVGGAGVLAILATTATQLLWGFGTLIKS